MNQKRTSMLLTGFAVGASVLASQLAAAADKEPQIPTCDKRYGTLAVRELDTGAMLYPTGEKQGPFWKVMDDLGNEGWVPMGLLEVAK